MAAEPKRTAGGDGLLPLEIWREILSRVPVKSILRCRSVSKAWYSLISCPNFISDYSLRNLNKNGSRVLLQPNPRANAKNVNRGIVRTFPFSSHNESFTESREHDEVPQAFLDSDLLSNVRIVGSCNGLICLSKLVSNYNAEVINLLIWNPTIRKVVELPARSFRSRRFSYYGFGFDFKTGDYKVMCTHSVYSGRKNCDSSDADADVCEIYDLSKGVWRGISPLMRSWNVWGGAPECYLNGAVHWSSSRHPMSTDRILLSFDMSDEIFREIRLPDCAPFDWDDNGESPIETQSVTFGGLIHVIVWLREAYRDDDDDDDMDDDCSVWAMKEYGVTESWTKLFNIDLQIAKVYQGTEPGRFRLWGNGEVLMVHDLPEEGHDYDDDDYDWAKHVRFSDRQEFVLYNTESRKCKQLLLFTTMRIRDMCLYEESLVLM